MFSMKMQNFILWMISSVSFENFFRIKSWLLKYTFSIVLGYTKSIVLGYT